MAKKIQTQSTTKITPQDIENKLRAFQGEVHDRVDDRKSSIVTAAAAGGFVVMLIVFLLGRRSGKRRTAVVEIRRV